MDLSKVYIILDHPDECRNIGSACRAMANSDITHLRIVGKKEDYDIEKVHILAIHAAYIYDNAEFFDSITKATKDCAIAAGTTRRRGQNRKGKLYLPEEFAETADKLTGSPAEGNEGSKIAVVFGNERTGLTDDQLKECTMGVTIPSSNDFGSLNLSHAVQIISYHLFRKKNDFLTGYTPLSLERLDKSIKVIADSLQKIGFFKVTGRSDMEAFWRAILSRAGLSEGEAQYIEKVFSKAAGLAGKKSGRNPATKQDSVLVSQSLEK
ncbi:MAG: RNA methyltransferase [Treponema sp.]|nr:RNA methyltransferase [Treponema sp.]